jgi:hypothetical protein
MPVVTPHGQPNMPRNNNGCLQGLASTATRVAVALIAFLLVASTAAPADASGLAREYELKAAFLCNFTAFVEWPENAVPDADGAFVIGVLGDDPFGVVLDEIAAVKTAHGMPTIVRRFASLDDYTPCHVLFVAASERQHLHTIIERLGDSPTLLVGDTEGFAQAGGMVNLVIEKKKVRFEINPAAAARAGLKISSKLLRLAKIVSEEAAAESATDDKH